MLFFFFFFACFFFYLFIFAHPFRYTERAFGINFQCLHGFFKNAVNDGKVLLQACCPV